MYNGQISLWTYFRLQMLMEISKLDGNTIILTSIYGSNIVVGKEYSHIAIDKFHRQANIILWGSQTPSFLLRRPRGRKWGKEYVGCKSQIL